MFGPVLFMLYTTPQTGHIEKHCICHEMFAGDTHLKHSDSPGNYSDLVRSPHDCVKDIWLWMEVNKLKLNNDKTEATLPLQHKIFLSDTKIEFSGIIHNFGFIFDIDLLMKPHIIKACKTA